MVPQTTMPRILKKEKDEEEKGDKRVKVEKEKGQHLNKKTRRKRTRKIAKFSYISTGYEPHDNTDKGNIQMVFV